VNANTQRARLLCGIILLFVVGSLHAQYVLIVQQRVSVSRALAGHAESGISVEPAVGVRVDLYSSDWQTILISTTTDKTGHFSFENPPKQRLYCIQLSSPGIDPYRLRVRLKTNASNELKIVLKVAS